MTAEKYLEKHELQDEDFEIYEDFECLGANMTAIMSAMQSYADYVAAERIAEAVKAERERCAEEEALLESPNKQ